MKKEYEKKNKAKASADLSFTSEVKTTDIQRLMEEIAHKEKLIESKEIENELIAVKDLIFLYQKVATKE